MALNKGVERKLACRYGIRCSRVNDIVSKENLQNIHNLKPDLIVCLHFSQILRGELLSLPKYGVINCHASPLPQCRGLGSIFQPQYYNDKYVGATVHFVNAKIDEEVF